MGDTMKWHEFVRQQKAMKDELEDKSLTGPLDNKAEPEEWPLKMAPERYIALNANSDNPDVQARVALARRLIEAT
jgi:hypothetical protein